MPIQRVTAGTYREIWRDAALLDGGTSIAVPTGIRANAVSLPQVFGVLELRTPVGAPVVPPPVLSVVNGRLVVTITNLAAPGNAAAWQLDVELTHSLQQGRDPSGQGAIYVIGSGGAPTADWPTIVGGVPWRRYFIIDGDAGNDANVGYIDAPVGTQFTPAQAAAVAIKTTDHLEALIPPNGAGRGYVILMKPRAGRVLYDAAVAGDAVGSFRRDLRIGYSSEIMRGSDLTNSVADRAQLGMVTAYGPFTVALVGSDANGWYVKTTAPVGAAANTIGRYRLRSSTFAGTFYAACRWGDLAAIPDPTIIRTRSNSFGPLAPGDTIWLEEPGARIYNYVEGVLNAVLPPGYTQANRLQLAGIEIGNNDSGIDGIVRLGANTAGEAGGLSSPPNYCCVRSDTAIIVGSLIANGQFTDEAGNLALPAATGLDLAGGCTTTPAVDLLTISNSYIDISTSLTASLVDISASFVLSLYAIRGEKGIRINGVDYEQIFVQPRSLCQIEGVSWVQPGVNPVGIQVLPDTGAPASVRFVGGGSLYGPAPALPGITLYHGQYTVIFDLDSALTLGTGVVVRHDSAGGTAQTLVTYASLGATGFEVEGGQKIACTKSGLGYPNNVLPCPRGVVMRLVDGVAGTASPAGLVVTAPAATPSRFALALSDAVANMRIVGALLTNVVQGDGATEDGYAVVGYDGLMVLRQEVGSANPVSGDVLYLSATAAGCVTVALPAAPSMILGKASPIGANALGTGVLTPTAWEPERPVEPA